MNDNDTMARIADARIARALRMLAKVVDDPTRETSASDDIEAIATALEAPAPASEPPTMKGCGTCGDQWGLCDCAPPAARMAAAEQLAPASEPPAAPAPCAHEHRDLVLKCWYCWREDKPEPPAAPEPLPPLDGPPIHQCSDIVCGKAREWERIARAERAERERERAKFADVVTLMNESAALAKKAERERDEAQATAARLAVERNALREQRDAALRALGEA